VGSIVQFTYLMFHQQYTDAALIRDMISTPQAIWFTDGTPQQVTQRVRQIVIPADAQDWCNPPDRGVGLRPTTNTGDPLLDAYLWVKIPGESDGLCYRWTQGPLDPVRNMQDPPAGQWFPQMALELVRNANPPLQ
jgi:cellulase/cellobiase CelA1